MRPSLISALLKIKSIGTVVHFIHWYKLVSVSNKYESENRWFWHRSGWNEHYRQWFRCGQRYWCWGLVNIDSPVLSCPVRKLKINNFAEEKDAAVRGGPPPIIFERLKLPQQIIYHRKENLSESPDHQKYWRNILISRFYEQFSRSSRNLGHFWKFEKNFKLLEYKHIIYHFEAGDVAIPNI